MPWNEKLQVIWGKYSEWGKGIVPGETETKRERFLLYLVFLFFFGIGFWGGCIRPAYHCDKMLLSPTVRKGSSVLVSALSLSRAVVKIERWGFITRRRIHPD